MIAEAPGVFHDEDEFSYRRRLAAVRAALLRGPVLLFAAAYGVYAGLGLYTTLRLHLVVGDAQSRLAAAYFALWDEPAKLAAMGFFWPPLQTLVLIPFAAIRPLATSNAALPLSSALFAAGTVVVIERTLALTGIRPWLRWAIAAAFGLNPLVLFYAGNGMAESLYLFLVTSALAVFVRWALAPRWHHLLHVGVLFGFGVLARYEVAFWLPVLVVGIAIVYASRRATFSRIEASVLVVGVPVAYAGLLWMYFNWALVGDPLAFVHAGLGVAGASTIVAGPVAAEAAPSALEKIWRAWRLQFDVFPATLLVSAALLAFAVLRRQVVALVLAALVLVNGASAALWAIWGGGGVSMHLRYNLRAMPIAVLVSAWLLASLPGRLRTGAAAVLLVAIAGSIPLTVRTMLHYNNAKGEHAFIDALRTGKSQDNVQQPVGTGIPVGQAEAMAHYIRRHAQGRNTVLTDNAQTFGIMLADGHPERYLDRIDLGDAKWKAVRDNPVGRVRYFLIQRRVTAVRLDRDLIVVRYPGLVVGKGRPPFVQRLLYRTPKYALFSLVEKRVVWGRGVWYRRSGLEAYLARRGLSWRVWKANHPRAARILEAQARRSQGAA